MRARLHAANAIAVVRGPVDPVGARIPPGRPKAGDGAGGHLRLEGTYRVTADRVADAAHPASVATTGKKSLPALASRAMQWSHSASLAA